MTINKIKEAIRFVESKIPIKGYMNHDERFIFHSKLFLKYFKQGDKVIDFGSGICQVSGVLQQLGFKCTAYDDLNDEWHLRDGNRQKILDFAKEINVDFHLEDDLFLPFEKGTFDIFMMNDVLEHIHDSPRELLNKGLDIVRPEGYIYISVPNAVNIKKRLKVLIGRTNMAPYAQYFWYPGPWRGHIREYTRKDLRLMAKFLNLKVIKLTTANNMLKKLPKILHPFYKLVTIIFPDWRDTWVLVAQKNKGWKPIQLKSQQEFDNIMSTNKKV